MAVINYNSEKMALNIMPKINNALEALSRAMEASYYLDVPSDFVNYTYLDNLNHNLKRNYTEIEAIIIDMKNMMNEEDKEVSLILQNINNID